MVRSRRLGSCETTPICRRIQLGARVRALTPSKIMPSVKSMLEGS
ncbi:hypothetical protein TSMEX_007024 [Taenia solium]|eukprot:TsM_000316800 transcript=TsM_000316800 gene=TsM_000316800